MNQVQFVITGSFAALEPRVYPGVSISHNNPNARKLLNRLFIKTCKPKDRLPFYQTSEIFPSGLEFEKKFSEIKHEVLNLIKTRELTTYQDIDANRAKEVSLKWNLYNQI